MILGHAGYEGFTRGFGQKMTDQAEKIYNLARLHGKTKVLILDPTN